MCTHTYSDRAPQYTWIYVEYTHTFWPLWRYILHYLRIHSGYTSIHKYMPKYSCNTVMIHVLCVRRKNSVRTRTVLYVSQVSARNTWEIHLEIHVEYNARLCVFIGVTWILPEYSSNILKYTLVPYFTCRRSAPGIPEEYTSQYTQNTTRVRVYSLGAHLNTDSYTQVYMYLECVDCIQT